MSSQPWLRGFVSWVGRGVAAAVFSATTLCGYTQDDQARLWSDATGKFKVSAKLVGQLDGAVRLEKPDGTVVSVDVAKLSKTDQDYLARRAKRINYKEIELAASQLVTSLPSESQPLPLDAAAVVDLLSDTVGPIDPDPAAAKIPYTPFAVPLSESNAYLSWYKPVALAPGSGVFAITAVDTKGGTRPGERKGSLLRCGYGRRLPDLLLQIDDSIHLVGHDVASGRTLVRVGGAEYDAAGDLVMLEGVLEGAVTIVCRRSPPTPSDSKLPMRFERTWLIDGTRMAATTFDTLYVWDIVANKAIYKRPAKFAAISPGGRYLASVEDSFVRIIDVENGDSLGTVPVKCSSNTDLAFDQSGERLAIITIQQMNVWNLASAEMDVEVISATHFGEPIGWVGDQLIFTDNGNLIDVTAQMTIWSYYLPVAEAKMVLDGGILAVQEENRIDVLRSLPIPHPAAAKLSDKLSRGSAKEFIVKPGDAVRVTVQADQPIDQEPIREALEEAVAEAGWVPADKASIEVAAVISRGKQESLTFEFGFGPNKRRESATITPFTAELQVRKGSSVLWSSYRSKNIPTVILLQNGETVQAAVDEYEKPDAEFFRRIQVPPAIPSPSLLKMIGKSSLKSGTWVDN